MVLETNAVHYRLQSDIIYTFCGTISHKHTYQRSKDQHSCKFDRFVDFKVATKWKIPKLFYYHSNSFIRLRLLHFCPKRARTHTHTNNFAIGRLLCIFFSPLYSFCISGVIKWNGISIFATIFISFHYAWMLCMRQFRFWMHIFSRLCFQRKANTFNYWITTFSVNFPSPIPTRMRKRKIRTVVSKRIFQHLILYITPQTNQSTNQKWTTQTTVEK